MGEIKMKTRKHFNAIFRESKYGWYLTRETYIPALTPTARSYAINQKQINRYIADALKNYDLNMLFYESLNSENFNNELNKFLNKFPQFKQLTDLNEAKNKEGYYIMVLDKYKQLYIGTGKDIYTRLRKHLSDNIDFWNLLWGDVTESKLSINSFRPFDTTRIYVYYTPDSFKLEDYYINEINSDYILNRTCGGIQEQGIFSAFLNRKIRNFNKKTTI